jgi:hypothetical protein
MIKKLEKHFYGNLGNCLNKIVHCKTQAIAQGKAYEADLLYEVYCFAEIRDFFWDIFNSDAMEFCNEQIEELKSWVDYLRERKNELNQFLPLAKEPAIEQGLFENMVIYQNASDALEAIYK